MTPTACATLRAQIGESVIPPRRHQKIQRDYDRMAYKQCWGIQGFFAKLKQWRFIATRHEKLYANFLCFFKIASIVLCCSHYSLDVGPLGHLAWNGEEGRYRSPRQGKGAFALQQQAVALFP